MLQFIFVRIPIAQEHFLGNQYDINFAEKSI